MSPVATEPVSTEVIEVTTLASAKPVEDEFKPLVAEVERLKATAETLEVTDENDKRGMKLARETRLTLREIRIGVEKRRKQLKEDYLRKGQRIDLAAKEITKLIEPLEARMLEQEQYAERRLAERQAKLQEERVADLQALGAPAHMIVQGLGTLTDQEWEILRKDVEAVQAARLAEAKRIEEERIAREKAEAEERERKERELAEAKANAEAERKAREAAEAAAKAERERAEAERLEAERKAKAERERLEAERREVELKAAEERRKAAAEAEARLQAERATAAAKAEEERKAREKVEAELRAKAEAERRERERLEAEAKAAKEAVEQAARAQAAAEAKRQAEAERQAKEEAEAKRRAELAPDADKIRAFGAEVESLAPKLANGELNTRLAAAVRGFCGVLEKLAAV